MAVFAFVREKQAEQQYYTPEERVAMEILANKVKNGAGRILTTDGAQVMLRFSGTSVRATR